MKILLDENIPLRIKNEFDVSFDVFTAREMDWNGKKNGELLSLLSSNDFDILITLDKNLRHQQNLSKYDIKIVIIRTINNDFDTLKEIIPIVIAEIKKGLKLKVTEVY